MDPRLGGRWLHPDRPRAVANAFTTVTLIMSARSSAAGGGIGLGTVVAAVLSWSANHSGLWLIVHGFLGWFYVLYHVFFR